MGDLGEIRGEVGGEIGGEIEAGGSNDSVSKSSGVRVESPVCGVNRLWSQPFLE